MIFTIYLTFYIVLWSRHLIIILIHQLIIMFKQPTTDCMVDDKLWKWLLPCSTMNYFYTSNIYFYRPTNSIKLIAMIVIYYNRENVRNEMSLKPILYMVKRSRSKLPGKFIKHYRLDNFWRIGSKWCDIFSKCFYELK